MTNTQNTSEEITKITEVIHNSIGWAANKDTTMLYSCFAHDPELFWFSPRDDGTTNGFDSFKKTTETFFMNPEFKAVKFEVKQLKVNLSESGTVAWFHCRLDDYNTWKGESANWEDVRWTGVLEKRDGNWVIVQQHFSSPTDREQ